jgi:beta-aspartyl-peptidase (threonine type)
MGFFSKKDTAERQTVDIGKCNQGNKFVMVIHGGAGYRKYKLKEKAALIKDLLDNCKKLLHDGATSLDVVHFAIREMEDSGLFNAGRGSRKNKNGFVEMDASIMDGKNMQAGAVASVSSKIKNPISAAKLILEKSDNVMFVGENAEKYVNKIDSLNIGVDDNERFSKFDTVSFHGTVGSVALDKCGNLAAGTSTGGFGRKIPGRVGDSPIIGAGTYANDKVAVSCTGHGEYFIRWSVAHDVAALYTYKNLTIAEAAKQALDKVVTNGGTGGIIAIDSAGDITMPFNTKGMMRGSVSNNTEPLVAIY